MATLSGFARRMKARAKKIDKNVNFAVRKAAIAGDQVLTTQTPVDTGRAASNWIASIGAPDTGESGPPFDPFSAHTANIGIIGRRQNEQTIFLSNNVDYIVFLDQGSSAQAPNGMTTRAIAEILNVIRTTKVMRR